MTVLFVSDCVHQRDLYGLALEPEVQTLSATSGEEALAHARTTRPDVIVLDVLMPGPDGWGICRRLKADTATAPVPVIMLTTYSNPLTALRARQAGASVVLTKPCPADTLLHAIRTALTSGDAAA